MPLKIIQTEDGSQSLYDEELNETYHSTKGARGESEYVFLEMGVRSVTARRLRDCKYQPLNILEVGFGTGLNALLTWDWADRNKTPIHFLTLEPFPITELVWSQMDLKEDQRFVKLHEANWNEAGETSVYFTLEKRMEKLEEFKANGTVDVIFFDAFAPSKQPEVWSIDNLRRCFNSLRSGGILTTYCAQGQFKRNLAEVGFQVEVLPGAMGKKEMVRGRK